MDFVGEKFKTAATFIIIFYFCIYMGECQTRLNISETAGKDTVVAKNTQRENCSMIQISHSVLDGYFRFDEEQSLVLEKPLDLDVLFSVYDVQNGFQVTTRCNDPQQVKISIHVIPVNEFNPEFIKKPYNLQVPEDTLPGTPIFCLFCSKQNAFVKDLDKIRYGNISNFAFIPHEIQGLDGAHMFNIDQVTGNITTNGTFDYESRNKLFFVKVQAQDDGGRKGDASIRINITDVDDNPPKFTQPFCDVISCDVLYYRAEIDMFMEGKLTNVVPAQIHAVDIDTGKDNGIEYSLTSDHETNLTLNVWISNRTGELYVEEPFCNITDVPDHVPLILHFGVTATENSTNAFNATTSLTVVVYRSLTTIPPSTTSEIPETTEVPAVPVPRKSENDLLLMLVEIIVPSVVVIIVIAVFVFFIVRRNRKAKERSIYEVKEGARVYKNVIGDRDMAVEPRASFVINPYELLNHYDASHYARFDSMEPNNETMTDGNDQFIRAINMNDHSAEEKNDVVSNGSENLDYLYTSVDKKKTKSNKNNATDLFDEENNSHAVENQGFDVDNSITVHQKELGEADGDSLGYKDMKDTEY